MIALICVIAVVALISLYDHFNSRSWQQVTSEERNEAVFEKRNRAYGAYAIRRDYDKRLMLIVAGLAGGIGVLYAATRGGEIQKVVKPTKQIAYQIKFDPKQDEEDKQDIVKDQPAAASSQQQTEFPVPIPDDDASNTITPPEPGLPVGPPTPPNPGGDPFGIAPPGPPTGGTGGGTPPPPPPPVGPVIADEPAEFPGGINKMRSFIADNLVYPQIAKDLEIEGKCFLRFVVSTEGDISDVTVMRGVTDCPECDKEAKRVIKIMPRWKPGKLNGKKVDSYFNIPITYTLK
jgi:periplasmic protein TonB